RRAVPAHGRVDRLRRDLHPRVAAGRLATRVRADGGRGAVTTVPTLVVVGLDTSLTSTGVARVEIGPAYSAIETETITSKHTGCERMAELLHLTLRAAELDTVHRLFIAMEGPSYHSSSAYSHENAGLWWQVRQGLWASNVQPAIVSPASLKSYATG